MSVRLGAIAALAGCACIAASACGGESSPPPRQASTAPSTIPCGAVPERLVGTYTMTLRPEDVTPEVYDIRTGKGYLSLGPGHDGFRYQAGTFEGAAKERADFGGRVCVSGDLLSFPDDPPGGACAGFGRSVFRWRLRGSELRMSVVRDACVYSAFHHSVKPWSKVSDRPGFDES